MNNAPVIPDVPEGATGNIIAWVVVAILVVVVVGAVAITKTLAPMLQEMLHSVSKIDDAVNHRHPGAPRLADHVSEIRGVVERVERKLEELVEMNAVDHHDFRRDIAALKEWNARWDELPPELATDAGLLNKLHIIETALDELRAIVGEHIEWEVAEKYKET